MNVITKTLTILSIVIIVSIFPFKVNAEKYEGWKITLRGGTEGKDGNMKYDYVCEDPKTHTLTCSRPGKITCPVQYHATNNTIPSEILAAISMKAIDIIKEKIKSGETNGQIVLDKILYNWTEGILLENGNFEMTLVTIPYESIIE